MRRRALVPALAVAVAVSLPASARDARFTDTFPVETCRFASTGANPYFVLRPGHKLTLKGTEGADEVELTVTVLDETRVVAGVTTRVVEERETENGELVEVSRNYFAVCEPTGTVFYFGEDVDIYENGAVRSHDGAWHAGENGARAGVIMPGLNLLGARYFQEIAPGVAMDRAETVGVDEVATTPAGRFAHVLKVEESTSLEPGAKEFKLYAPGIGLISDGKLRLTAVEKGP